MICKVPTSIEELRRDWEKLSYTPAGEEPACWLYRLRRTESCHLWIRFELDRSFRVEVTGCGPDWHDDAKMLEEIIVDAIDKVEWAEAVAWALRGATN
ncbi:hypothetical protein B7H23_12895 [Notoacmeibacter marinus]|uniref:Uncharacterized protein n=1 Tax=Notoacmeibacter marinus TaxID=1876515 RepID=A0A231UT90_9HYPH|nr:hypothetical protein [Notoacmeibacter marinus]OXS99096.1 hypothetical protein B7H23_12895 [Notoacmeibacter marinus]